MTPTKDQTVECSIFTYKVENNIANHILQFEENHYCSMFLIWNAENYICFYISIVNITLF